MFPGLKKLFLRIFLWLHNMLRWQISLSCFKQIHHARFFKKLLIFHCSLHILKLQINTSCRHSFYHWRISLLCSHLFFKTQTSKNGKQSGFSQTPGWKHWISLCRTKSQQYDSGSWFLPNLIKIQSNRPIPFF